MLLDIQPSNLNWRDSLDVNTQIFINKLFQKDTIDERYNAFSVEAEFVKSILIDQRDFNCNKTIASEDTFRNKLILDSWFDDLIWEYSDFDERLRNSLSSVTAY